MSKPPVTNTCEGQTGSSVIGPGLENGFNRSEENNQIQPGAEVAKVEIVEA